MTIDGIWRFFHLLSVRVGCEYRFWVQEVVGSSPAAPTTMLESVFMRARIYLPPKSAMQSGRAGAEWVLHYDSATPERADPLMGWIGGGDTQAQVRLSFPTKEEAIAYAERNG